IRLCLKKIMNNKMLSKEELETLIKDDDLPIRFVQKKENTEIDVLSVFGVSHTDNSVVGTPLRTPSVQVSAPLSSVGVVGAPLKTPSVQFGAPLKTPPVQVSDNTESGVTSMFSGGLSLFSDMFHRLGGYPDDIYYYQAIQIQVKTSGTYTFTSDSYLDTIGYLYENSFDLTNLEENLMVQDDNSGGSNLQFRFETTLEAERTYILVVTTNVYGRTGRFSVSAHGPDSITFLPTVSELFENLG
ncbi:unnamed protein product, partial [Rotaria socialis]